MTHAATSVNGTAMAAPSPTNATMSWGEREDACWMIVFWTMTVGPLVGGAGRTSNVVLAVAEFEALSVTVARNS